MINKILLIIISLTTLFSIQIINAQDYKVIGYYPNWAIYRVPSFYPHDIDAYLVTHINYAFAKVDAQGNVQLFDSWADTDYGTVWNEDRPYWGNFKELAELKQKH